MSAQSAGWRALAALYNALMTGMVLSLVVRQGAEVAREYVFRHFRRQHLDKFLPGLAKLGLANEPHAVACALYHFHSNALGGVLTEFVRESDRKAWVRYPPPRWMWRGTAITAVPHEVSAAMLYGWHGHNGVTLGNPRLGFVCTGMTVDGHPGLEGYYLEHDHPLDESERVRFAYGAETMPRCDPRAMPVLDAASWPGERRQRTLCRYAMEYVRSMAPVLEGLLGVAVAYAELGRVARLIGLQFHAETACELGLPIGPGDGSEESAQAFARWLGAMLMAQGEDVEQHEEAGTVELRQHGWRLMRGVTLADPAGAFLAWKELMNGACLAHDRFLALECEPRAVGADAMQYVWRIRSRRA